MSPEKNPPPYEDDFDAEPKRGITLTPTWIAILILVNITILWFLGWRGAVLPSAASVQPSPTTQLAASSTPPPSATPTPEEPEVIVITATPAPDRPTSLPGMIVLSLSEAGYYNLFAYHPEKLPLTRLTFGDWDDTHPALSPDGAKVAFASHRNGQWDIFVLDLFSGLTTQITDDLAYDGHPSWSPESDFLAYEKNLDGNLDIYIDPIDGTLDPLRVTTDPAPDFQPDWSPSGSLIAFTSTRRGDRDIWVADIDFIGDSSHVTNFTFNTTIDQSNPAWSPHGDKLAWVASFQGYDTLFVSDYAQGTESAQSAGTGSQFSWDPTGQYLIAVVGSPDQHFLTAYYQGTNTFVLPPFTLSRLVQGISWNTDTFPPQLPEQVAEFAAQTVEAPWDPALTPSPGTLYGRPYMIDLTDVTAPHPALNALAIQPFVSLRDRVEEEAGWDILANLENAFIPLTQALPPGRSEDWLYTGRAFSLDPVLIDIDWMQIVREEYGPQTYWRVYIKTAKQDGSQGQPMFQYPWNFDARFSGNTTYYEQGGAEETHIPGGYWIDFTTLAAGYGWERFPALSNWQTYFQGIRFNVFAITSGLDWRDAMLQVWPPEIFINPPVPSVEP